MDELFEYERASTPLTDEEKEGLKSTWIAFRSELNAAEREGILKAETFFFQHKQKNILTVEFLKKVHHRMFKDVWNWAGTFRLTEKNIGIDPAQITEQVSILLGDTKFWIENQTYSPDEIGARFHHRLVYIHPFPNGNGRHSRLMTDILMKDMDQPQFSWGSGSLIEVSDLRNNYIQALQAADNRDILPLLEFIRS